jgi:ribosomal protein L37E
MNMQRYECSHCGVWMVPFVQSSSTETPVYWDFCPSCGYTKNEREQLKESYAPQPTI